MEKPAPTAESPARSIRRSNWTRIALLIALAAGLVITYVFWGDQLAIDRLAEREQQFRAALVDQPVVTILAAFAAYVLITATFFGSATVVSLCYGWLFGFLLGALLISFASTTSATLTFLASRYLFRESLQKRFAGQFERIDRAFAKTGATYLLSLRLIPGIPFFLVNTLMGLTRIRLRTYWWVSQLGMLPATLIFVYAGSTVPSLATIRVQGVSGLINARFLVALLLLGLLPLFWAGLRRLRMGSGLGNNGQPES